MAKLLAPYSLCPLIEQRWFLGVHEDSTPGCVIVTLGQNIIIRYRLSDQKQVCSWSSKTKLTTPVVYDHSTSNYVGVFNSESIGFWQDRLAQLNKIRKFKFTWLVHSVLSGKDCPAILVYRNGIVGQLQNELTVRKNPVPPKQLYLSTEENIVSSKLVSLSGDYYVCLLTHHAQNGTKVLHFVPVDPDSGSKFLISLNRKVATISAFTVVEGISPFLLTLWSDGVLRSEQLPPKEEVKLKTIANVSSINTQLPATMLPIAENHIALYGAAPNGEGASLMILSLKFGLPEAVQKMKVYDDRCEMWLCRNDIIIRCGTSLVVAPFRLGTTRLVSLLGMGTKDNSDLKTEISDLTNGDISTNENIENLKSAGKTDQMICNELLGILIKNKDTKAIINVLDNVIGISDRWIISLVSYSIESGSAGLLKRLLSSPLVGDCTTLAELRNALNIKTVLSLLQTITDELSNGSGDECLLSWAMHLLDSHYQQYVLSKDDEVVNTLKAMKHIIRDYMDNYTMLNELNTEIRFLEKGKARSLKYKVASHSYVLEKIQLY